MGELLGCRAQSAFFEGPSSPVVLYLSFQSSHSPVQSPLSMPERKSGGGTAICATAAFWELNPGPLETKTLPRAHLLTFMQEKLGMPCES